MNSLKILLYLGLLFQSLYGLDPDELERRYNFLRRVELEAAHTPELGVFYRQDDLAGEESSRWDIKARAHLKTAISLIAQARQDSFELDNGDQEDLSSGAFRFVYEKTKFHTVVLGLETGHEGRIGAEAEWVGSLRHQVYHELKLWTRAGRTSHAELRAGEKFTGASTSIYWDLPKWAYLSTKVQYDQVELDDAGDLTGDEWRGNLSLGVEVVLKNYFKYGEPFFDEDFRYQDPLTYRANLYLSQTVSHFDASDNFFLALPRTEKSELLELAGALELPVSKRLALELNAGVGQDLARDLNFGKIRNFKGLVRMMPNARLQCRIGIQHRSENVGAIAGRSNSFFFSLQANL